MAVNQAFDNYNFTSEQDLLEDLIIESIQISGIDFQYLPRTLTNVSPLYKEDRVYQYNHAIPIEVYPENINGFGGESDLISKFGLEIRDEITFTISQRRWRELVGDPLGRIRPLEGDIIYMEEPFTQLFQVTFVEHEAVFYQLGRLYVYQLKCKLFEYSNQVFNTGNIEVDTIGNTYDRNLEQIPIVDETNEVIVDDNNETIIVSDPLAVGEDNRAISTDDGDYIVTDDGEVIITSDTEPTDGAINDFLEDFGQTIINFDERDPFNTGIKY